jgi:ubiquinone biosynthesis monooxygenase Coq7
MIDRILIEIDRGLKLLSTPTIQTRDRPDKYILESASLSSSEKKIHSKYMRVNHSGEICAQGLYRGQLFFNKNKNIKNKLTEAALEEIDHLAWCDSRINELNGSKSKLNPILYIGSFSIGATASIIDDKYNLGFLSETESQVALHLESHIKKLNPLDKKTLKIIQSMKEEEEGHKKSAVEMGGVELPKIIKKMMSVASKIMTSITYKI